MDHDAVRNALDAVAGEDVGGLDNFAIEGTSLDEATVTRFDVDQELAKRVTADVQRAAASLARRQLLAYDPSYQTNASQALVEPVSDIAALATVDTAVRAGDVANRGDEVAVVAMAHSLLVGTTRVVAYRFKGAGIAALSAKALPLLPRDGVYTEISGDLLYYEPRFDAVTIEGYAIFTNASLIQRKLLADDKARDLARTTLRDVTTSITIDGYDELERAVVDDPTMRAKMAAVARLLDSDPAYAANLTTAKLVGFAEQNPDYDIPITTVDGMKVLQFNASPQHRHQILHLLADDYLHSYLTDRHYEAGSKHRVTP